MGRIASQVEASSVRVRRSAAAVALVAVASSGVIAAPATAAPVRAVASAAPATDPHAPTGHASLRGLQPMMRHSMEVAIAAARREGVHITITSGYRSPAEQQRLFDQAVARYGSPGAARRWVLRPSESAHVKGAAVDVGPRAGALWLERHGVRFGLCRRYVNEWWHVERLAGPIGSRCPRLQRDARG